MSSREKFEQAIKARFGGLIDYRVCKNSDGEYMAWGIQVAWWAWQAAETDMAVQLANAESKCRELAAENAGLKGFGKTLSEMHEGLDGSGTGIQGEHEAVCQQVALDAAMDAFDEIKAPATDSFLAEVRASALEYYANLFKDTVNMGVKHNQEFHRGTLYVADQFRKGAAQ